MTARPLVIDPRSGGRAEGQHRRAGALLGIEPAALAPAVALDCAMPAVQQLRALRPKLDRAMTLTFWTPRRSRQREPAR